MKPKIAFRLVVLVVLLGEFISDFFANHAGLIVTTGTIAAAAYVVYQRRKTAR